MFPPNKRKRTLSQGSETSALDQPESSRSNPTRSEEFYFDDGNIVLVAEDVAFRVHRNQLARHSEVFRDMMGLPQQPEDAETFDGCLVVRLSDRRKDICELLRVLYDHVRFNPSNLDQLTSVLRMSTKYLVDHLRVAALESFAEVYPDTLNKYDQSRRYPGVGSKAGDIIKLAYELHADALLPAAYYDLCSCPIEDVLASGLPQSALMTYLIGKDKLSTRLAAFVKTKIKDREIDEDNDCLSLSICRDRLTDIQRMALDMLAEPCSISTPNPLSTIATFNTCTTFTLFCQECRGTFDWYVEKERRDIWTSLPVIFNLGSWRELQKKK